MYYAIACLILCINPLSDNYFIHNRFPQVRIVVKRKKIS